MKFCRFRNAGVRAATIGPPTSFITSSFMSPSCSPISLSVMGIFFARSCISLSALFMMFSIPCRPIDWSFRAICSLCPRKRFACFTISISGLLALMVFFSISAKPATMSFTGAGRARAAAATLPIIMTSWSFVFVVFFPVSTKASTSCPRATPACRAMSDRRA